jgi:glycosyltransferase involved in cell wall biosynthesis
VRAELTHVSPGFFGPDGVLGGGERYALELARAMSALVPTRLVSFGAEGRTFSLDDLEVAILPLRTRWKGHSTNPLSERLVPEILRARSLHVHQLESVVANICLVAGAATRKPVYVTDHGGGGRNYRRPLRLDRLVRAFLPVSRFSASLHPELADRTTVVWSGADVARFHPDGGRRERQVVFVGRILPHKGIDVLVEALPAGVALHVYGRTYDPAYRAVLDRLAVGKEVAFHESASDEEIAEAYRRSRVAVLPSVTEPRYGKRAPNAELLGLALLEAMASGTPVICTEVGGMPEVVREGETGFVVPQNDPIALRERIQELVEGSSLWESMSAEDVEHVRAEFTWRRVAERCLAAYESARAPR